MSGVHTPGTLKAFASILLLAGLAGCGGDPAPETPNPPEQTGVSSLLDLDTEQYLQLHEPWTGDYDEIASGKRRFLRALVPFNKTLYFIERAEQKGIAYESLRELERQLARTVKKGNPPPKIIIIPTRRDRLIPALAEGLGDIAIGALTVTTGREQLVEFSQPTMEDIHEVVVTGAGAPRIDNLEQLGRLEIQVRRSSSYYASLEALAARLKASGKPGLRVIAADELLETEDLLEMVGAGMLQATVADAYIARLSSQIYPGLVVREDLVLRGDGRLGWAVRKGAPQLLGIVNSFVAKHRQGTLFGNVILSRYLSTAARLSNPAAEDEVRRFREIIGYLRRYAEQYNFDWLLVSAQAYQESRLDNRKRSPAGAIGVMQIKPSTAADMGIHDIRPVEKNIEAGVKYLRYMADRYFASYGMTELDRELFSIVACNAGPARIASLRREAAGHGLDPNVWFSNVEVVAARRIGRETVDYVSNIYKYYVAYKAIAATTEAKDRLPGAVNATTPGPMGGD